MALCAMAMNDHVWWLRLTCFFFFAGLSCLTPLLTAHLQWLGLDLQEIGFINLIASFGSALGLGLAWTWSPRCGHRSNLAVAILLAAFCVAGIVLIPRINGRPARESLYYSEAERPVAEILCRPEGSALFFRKCGDSCQLDSVTRTELSVSDCRFEEETRFPGSSFLDWINRFALPNPNAASGGSEDEEDGEGSEPERGDLPQKILPSSTTTSRTSEDFDINFDADSVGAGLLPDEGPSASSGAAGNAGIDPFEYDYEENHREEVGGGSTILKDILGEGRKRRRRTAPHRRPQLGDIDSSWSHHLDEEFNVNEKDELPRTTSPHICFTSGDAASTTTCHVFTGTNHLFRFNTSFYRGVTHNGQCFYSLNYDDVEHHILSELRCRSNRPDHQVRCRAEGVKLRASVTRNGTNASTCGSQAGLGRDSNFHVVYWLYLVFRTCGEAAILGAFLLLRIITYTEEQDLLVAHPVRWWAWGLAGFVMAAPLAGWIADQVGFGIAFLLGSLLLGLAAFAIALSPTPQHKPPLGQILASIEEDVEEELPMYRLVGRELLTVASCLHTSTGFLILLFMLLMGMAHSVVSTAFYWYLLELDASRLTLGTSVSAQLVASPFVLLFSRWLFKRCGPRYIFIIGLLIYSLRFLGYTLLHQTYLLVVMETMEPLCGLWMLLTASARLQQLQWVNDSNPKPHWKVNTWAMIILFHYSFGRGLGGFLSSLAAHYFGLMKVFVGAALISLFVAAAWFLWIHLIANSLRIQQKKSCCSCQSFSRRKNRATLDATAVDDVDDFDAPTQFPKGKKSSPDSVNEKETKTQQAKCEIAV